MKKNQIASVLLMAVLLVSLPAHAEKQKKGVTVEQVMDKYIEAIGGKKEIAKIKDITMSQKIIGPDGESVLVTKQLNKKDEILVMSEYYMNGLMVRKSVYLPEQAIIVMPQGTQNVNGLMAKAPYQMAALIIEQAYPIVDVTPVLVGETTIKGKKVYHVRAVFGGVIAVNSYYDVETGLKIFIGDTEDKEDGFLVEVTDYRKMDGSSVLFPFKLIQTDRKTKNIKITEVAEVKINKGLKEKDFK